MRGDGTFSKTSGRRLDPDFAFGRGFPFPDGRGAFEFCDCPFAGFERFLAVFPAGDDQYDVFTDFDVADAVNDAHVDQAVILEWLVRGFRRAFSPPFAGNAQS